MEKNYIDIFTILNSQDDRDLITKIKEIDFSQKTFLVLQMQGAHSPYRFHEELPSNNIKKNYFKCYKKSDKVLTNLIHYIQNKINNSIIIFTSDHGENLGENNQYGHNRFTPEVYKVPLVIEPKTDLSSIDSHLDLYYFMISKLGYELADDRLKHEKIKINGTMITGEDGFIEFLRKPEL